MSAYTPDPTDEGGPTGNPDPTVQAEQRKAEVARRVRAVLGLLMNRLFVADVLRLTEEKYAVNRATARRYLKLARAELVKSTGLTRREHRALSLAFYGRVVRESLAPSAPGADGSAPPTVSVRDGLDAQGRIDRLLGLAVDRDPELDALKATLRGLIAALEPHAAAARAAAAAGEG